ncbi:MAG: hypothetical protein ACRDHM_07930 [Actinomycetota bacterium]
MSKKQALAVIGVASALVSVYRWTRRVGQAAEDYQRRGPRWDVVIPGAVAVCMLVASLGAADTAIRKAKRAF